MSESGLELPFAIKLEPTLELALELEVKPEVEVEMEMEVKLLKHPPRKGAMEVKGKKVEKAGEGSECGRRL